jgi:hypothetical protein
VLKSRNPLLADIANFLVEETGAEEEALVDKAVEVNGGEAVQSMEIDQQMTQVSYYYCTVSISSTYCM